MSLIAGSAPACSFTIATDAELTVEMDPGTFDGAKVASYMAAGMNRVSLGVQSFDDELLQGAGRSHRFVFLASFPATTDSH